MLVQWSFIPRTPKFPFPGKLKDGPMLPEQDMNPKPWLFASMLALSGNAVAAQPTTADVTKKVLPNGMTILVKELHTAPVVAVNVWVKVGSVEESDKERGITHFIEHM